MKRTSAFSIGTMVLLTVCMLLLTPRTYAQVDVTIGTGTINNTTSGYPAPYGNFYYGARHQFLIPASEIIAAGGSADHILALAFDVSSAQGTPLTNFEIKIGATTATNLATWHTGPMDPVYLAPSYTDVAGWNVHTFTTPFSWDGTSNLVIETCFNNTGWSNNAIHNQSATTYESSVWYRADNATVCSSTSTTDFAFQRPNMRLTLGPPPACLVPTSLTAFNITPTALDLDWTENSGATEWEIEGVLAGTPQGTGLTGITTTKPANIPGLDPSTAYDFYVRSICAPGDTSGWAGPYTVTTAFACPPNAVCETYTTGDIASDMGFQSLGQLSSCPGTMTITIPPGNWITSVDVEYEMTTGSGAYMSEQRSWMYCVNTSMGEADVASGSGLGGTYSYARTGLTFANGATGNVDIVMHAGRTWGGSGCDASYNKVDDGTWMVVAYYGPAPSCVLPSGLMATNITSTTVDLDWTENSGATEWEIEGVLAGAPQGTGMTGITTTKPATIPGLDPATAYDFYVRSICAPGDTSDWAGPYSVTTPAAPFVCPPNTYCFTSAGATGRVGPTQTQIDATYLPGDSLYNSVTSVNGIQQWVVPESGLYRLTALGAGYDEVSNQRGAKIEGEFILAQGEILQVLVGQIGSAAINGSGGTFVVSNPFNTVGNILVAAGGAGGHRTADLVNLQGQIGTAGADGSAGSGVNGGDNGAGGDGNTNAGGGAGFLGNGSGIGGYAFINGGQGGDASSQGEGGFGGGGSSNNTSGAGGGGGYSGGGRTWGGEAGGGGSLNNGINPVNVAGYHAGDGIVMIELLPPPSCPFPAALSATFVSAGTMELGWTEIGTATEWEIEYDAEGFTQGTGNSVITTSNPYVLSGLSMMPYEFYVRSICAPGDTSDWTGPFGFGVPLIGTYTIGGASPDFATFTEAVTALKAGGVVGAVTFEVAPGTYNEQIILENYLGLSATNNITFKGADPATTILTFEQNVSDDRYTVRFDGASYITFEEMTIEADPNGTYGWAIHILPNTNNIVIQNCSIVTDVTTTSTFYNGVVASGTNTGYTATAANIENLRFEGNTIIGGYNGIRLNGVSTSKLNGAEIIDNTILETRHSGIYLSQVDGAEIHGNYIEGRPGITSGAGTWLTNVDNFSITENEIYNQGQYGVYMTASTGTAATPSLVANNAIAEVGNTGNFGSAIRVLGASSHIDIVYNSCLLSSNTGRVFQITVTTPSDIRLLNNSFVHMGGSTGYAMYINNASVISEIDNNNYYTNGSNFVYYDGSNRVDLAALQAVNTPVGNDLNSVSGDPVYSGPYFLFPLGAILNNAGQPFPGITTDILGETRDAVTPDIGAYEFTPINADIALLDALLVNGECLGVDDSLYLTISNTIGSAVDFSTHPLTAVWSVTGPVNSNGTIVLNSGTLAPTDDLTFGDVGPDLSVPGTYTLSAYLEPNVTNEFADNDTLLDHFTVEIVDPFYVEPKHYEVFLRDETVDITARSMFFPGGDFFITEICQWYAASSGAPPGGYPSWLPSVDFMEITGVPNSDLGGYTLEQWSTSALSDSYTFPPGTLLSPNGTAVIRIGTGSATNDPANFYYNGVGGTASWGSATQSGRIIKDPSGNIVDAVGYPGSAGNYTFPAAAGVTPADWSGNIPAANGTAGIRLIGPYTKDATNWVVANGSPHVQDPNSLNSGVTPPAPGALTGFTWTHNNVVTSTMPDSTVGPFTANGTYQYIASYNTPCGLLHDTVTIVVSIPPQDAELVEIIEIEGDCGMGLETIAVRIANAGLLPINGNLDLSYMIKGGTTVVTEAVTTPIGLTDTLLFTFATPADFSVTGADSLFEVIAWVDLLNDTIPQNDTAFMEVISLHIPDAPTVADVAIPAGTMATLTAISPYDVNWYEAFGDTIPVETGLTFITPVLNDVTTYWVEASSSTALEPVGVNIAPLAVANASSCQTGPCSSFNNQNYGTCGSQQVWMSTGGGPTPHVDFIDFEWNDAHTMDKMTIHHGATGTRFLTGGDIYYWDGNGWVYHHTFSNLPITQCENDIYFDIVTTTRLRITSFVVGGSQSNNPNFREIEIFSAAAPGCISVREPVTVSMEANATVITADTSICPGESVLLEVALDGTAPYTLIVTDGTDFDTIPGIPGPTFAMPVTPTATTTYSVVSVINGYGFANSSTAEVTVTLFPDVMVDAGADVEICYGTSTQLMATGIGGSGVYTNYQWSPAAGLSDVNIHNPIADPVTTTTFTVIVTDDNGCHAMDEVVVTVLPLPIVDAGMDADICDGASTQLAGSVTGGSGVYVEYHWTPADGLSDTTIADPIAAPIVTTTYTLTVTDDKGCQGVDHVVVNVHPLPIVDAGPDQSTCAGMMVFLNATTTGGTPPFSYEWTPDATLNNAFIHNPEATPTVNTTYTVTVTDLYGCQATDDVFIEATALPVANAGADVHICQGESTQLQASGGTTYEWSPAFGLSNTNISNPVAAPPFTMTYTVTVTSICGVATDDVVVNVNPNPWVVFIGLPDSTCLNTPPIPLTGAPTGGTFSGPGMVGSVFHPALAGAGGPYNITYTFTNANNCTESITMQVRVFAEPYVNIVATPATVCVDGAPLQLIGHPVGGTFSGPGIVGDTFDPALAGPGTHVFSYTFTNIHGCHNTVTRSINVAPLPNVAILNLASDYCLNDPMVNLQTNQQGGVFTGPGMGFGTFTPQVAGVGTHTVTYTFNDANGCTNSSSYQVTVHPAPTVAFVGLQSMYCVDAGPVALSATPSGGSFSGTGVFAGTLNPHLVGGGNSTNVTYNYTDPVTGCSSSITAHVTIRALPVVGLSAPNPNPCVNAAPMTLTGTPAGGTFSGTGITGNTFDPAAAGAGTHVITYTASNVYGCYNSATLNINVQPIPSVSMGGLASSYCLPTSQVVFLSGFPSGGTFSGPGVTGNTFNPTAAGVGTKTIKYTYTSPYGCTDSATVITTINETVATITGLDPTYCLNDPAAPLTGSTAGGATGTFTGTGMVGNTFHPSTAGVGGHTITYTVTNPQTGCTGIASQPVVVYAIPNVGFVSLPQHFCINSPVFTVVPTPATGGTLTGPGVTGLQFDPAAAGLGTHTLTYSFTNANGCTVEATEQVTVHGLPTVSFSGLASAYCENDDPVTLSGSPAGGSFSGPGIWAGGIFNPGSAHAGTHTISYTYTDTYGCSSVDSQMVVVHASPVVDLGADTSICINHTIVLDAGPGFTSYEWSTGETTQSITVDASNYTAGWHYFTVTVTNASNCEGTDEIRIIIMPCTGIEEAGEVQLYQVYPNPSDGIFNLKILNGESKYHMSIYNDIGQLIHSEQVETGGHSVFTHQVNLEQHPTGLYLIRLHGDHSSEVLKVIVH